MKKRYKCPKCNGHGSIDVPPIMPPGEWTSRRCEACDGQGYIEVDDADEVKK